MVDGIWLVDDGSRDGTAQVARGVGDARLRIVSHRNNQGVGAALTLGYRAAFEAGMDIAIVMAGDDQMDPADLPRLVETLLNSGAGYVKGTRLRGRRGAMPITRWVGNHALSALTRRVTGLDVSDSQCGYTALTREAANRIDLASLWPRYGYPNDLLVQMAFAGEHVVEVDVRSVYADEISGVRWVDAVFVVPFVLVRSWRKTRASRRASVEASAFPGV